MPDKPQRLRELIVLLGHEPLAEIPDVAEAIETEALEILDALVEQLEAHRKALVALIGWSDGDNGDDFGTTEWANARTLASNPASRSDDA